MTALRNWACIGALVFVSLGNAFAQSVEKQTGAVDAITSVRLVVPFPAGGSADIIARLIAKPLSIALDKPVVVDNKSGGDGAIAAENVASSSPDGRTLFFATYGAMSAVPHLHKAVSYDTSKDFTAIASVGRFSMFLFANPALPIKNYKQLLEYGHAHDGEISYGTGNVASIIMGAALNESSHLHMTAVPYRGEVPAMNDFLAGRIQLMFATPTNTLPFVREGKLVALASMSDRRSPLLPHVPTWKEAGMQEPVAQPWAGIFGPAHMSSEQVKKFNQVLNVILKQPEILKEFQQQGFEAHTSTPEQFEAFAAAQSASWKLAIQKSGLRPE